MNVGDRVRVDDEDSAVEGTIVETWILNGEVYVKLLYLDNLYISRSTSQYKISVLASAEPKELGTVIAGLMADGRRYVAVRAEIKDYEGKYAWYVPNADGSGSGSWHEWDEFKDVEVVR